MSGLSRREKSRSSNRAKAATDAALTRKNHSARASDGKPRGAGVSGADARRSFDVTQASLLRESGPQSLMPTHARANRRSASEKKEARCVAHYRNVPFARRNVFQMDDVAGTELSRLAVRRGDREHALDDSKQLDCGSGMIRTIYQVGGAPARLEVPRRTRLTPADCRQCRSARREGAKFCWARSAVSSPKWLSWSGVQYNRA